MRKLTAVAVAASAALVGMIAIAPVASAEPNPPDCPRGYACMFYVDATQGPAAVKTARNWFGSQPAGIGGSTVFNNGAPQPGRDHIQATWIFEGKTFGRCLHFNPGPGEYKFVLTRGTTLTSLVWRGECDD
ncbi:hypothetical protein [Amycolatopsis sp. NPDC059021]|uniref:hypothetical protein n=1 Tax=Amycolatopsis sp. NPDC059021 TaxID=3346704 RepID=UPI00366F4020